jgi:hypothetical protein
MNPLSWNITPPRFSGWLSGAGRFISEADLEPDPIDPACETYF